MWRAAYKHQTYIRDKFFKIQPTPEQVRNGSCTDYELVHGVVTPETVSQDAAKFALELESAHITPVLPSLRQGSKTGPLTTFGKLPLSPSSLLKKCADVLPLGAVMVARQTQSLLRALHWARASFETRRIERRRHHDASLNWPQSKDNTPTL